MLTLLKMLARYNRWANKAVYDAAAALPDADYRADCGAFFRSVHGTLNHLVVADMIWLGRFGAGEFPVLPLDATVADDLPPLRMMREKLDGDVIAFTEALTAELAATFSYVRGTVPEAVTQPLAPAVVHVFNHQTHHRGQVHALLTRLAGRAPSLDLVYYQRETGDGMN